MKKLLAIAVLSLLIGNIAHSARLDKTINAEGGHVKKWGNPSVNKILPLANSQCQSFNTGSKAVNLIQVHKGGLFSSPEFSYWHYDCQKKTQTSSSTNFSSGSSSSNKIAQSKKICKELGFKANSEKFADCALKMMAMQFETGNKVSNNDGSSTQQIIVKQQDDFDVGDFFFGLQKIVDDNYRSSNNNNSNQGTNCRIVPKAWGADMVCR